MKKIFKIVLVFCIVNLCCVSALAEVKSEMYKSGNYKNCHASIRAENNNLTVTDIRLTVSIISEDRDKILSEVNRIEEEYKKTDECKEKLKNIDAMITEIYGNLYD